PNPVLAEQMLRVDKTYSGLKFQIINHKGEMVMNGNISNSADISIDKMLGKGMYLLRIFTSTFAESGRFIIL
ncbi:MAG TPA: hypothetical protein DCL86_05525, partial [Bacteroidales bacterium]|nr:hypothetical protein [Bacteroidales bacterium]